MSAYSKIDEVEPALLFGTTGELGWGFTLWSNLLDDEAPHRKLLERFAQSRSDLVLTLPKWDRYEDFVEGSLKSAKYDVHIYYETILSYLALWSQDLEGIITLRQDLLSVALSA